MGLRMRFGNVNQTSLLPLLSPFTIFGCRRRQDASRPCKPSKLLLHGSRLSLSLTVIEDWLRRSPYASTVLEQVRDGIRLKRGFGCGSAMSIKQVCCHCTHLSLSLAAAEDRMRLGHANRASSFCMALDFHYLCYSKKCLDLSKAGYRNCFNPNRSLDTPGLFPMGEKEVPGFCLPSCMAYAKHRRITSLGYCMIFKTDKKTKTWNL